MTILIVEDNDSMRQMIKKLLGDLTEAFKECVDGAQPLQLTGNISRTGC